MQMQKKVIRISLILILCIMIMPVSSVYAKTKQGKLTVKYKGKTITLVTTKTNKKNSSMISTANASTIKKSWGKPQKTKTKFGEKYYYYKKGKTKMSFCVDRSWGNNKNLTLGGFDISIKDKNAKMCGIKVGMKKEKVIKILKKNFNNKAIEVSDDAVSLWFGPFFPITFKLDNNKVTEMRFWTS